MKSVLYYPTIPENEPCLGMWYTQWHSTRENRFSLYQQTSITNRSLVRCGTPCPLALLSAGILWTCAGPVHAVTGSVSSYVNWSCCVWKTPFPWSHLQLLVLRVFPLPLHFPLPHRSLSLQGRVVIKSSHSGLSEPKFFLIPGFHPHEFHLLADTTVYIVYH